MKLFSLLFFILFFAQACALPQSFKSAHRRSVLKPTEKKNAQFLSPEEYYQNIEPVRFSGPGFESWSRRSGMEVDNQLPEDKSEKRQAIVMGVLAGIALVAGVTVPIILLTK